MRDLRQSNGKFSCKNLICRTRNYLRTVDFISRLASPRTSFEMSSNFTLAATLNIYH